MYSKPPPGVVIIMVPVVVEIKVEGTADEPV
ncbi:hypothetical protein FHS90_004298 [Rufibacter quisquiliarum]|uniref:Uncharacterized protein n=1 Tax=Rufibacter quisquiliarum TaxID=1549639 RepID=A0A839GLI2_9BACT|nr:hypothetical protein [Rufibacter quisquiliarum]